MRNRIAIVLGVVAAGLGGCGGSDDSESGTPAATEGEDARAVDPAEAEERLTDAALNIGLYCTAKELAPPPAAVSVDKGESVDDLTALVGEAKDVEIEGGTTVETEVIQIIGQLERKNCDEASASQLDRALDAAG